MTDLTKWKLIVDRGRQIWKYIPSSETVQTVVDKYLLGLDVNNEAPPLEAPKTAMESLRNAITFYSKLQTEDGHWANDYGGPMFLMPGLIFTSYITGAVIPEEHKTEMIRYIFNHQNEDGGWGLHIESHSTIFGSSLNYVSVRMLGIDKNDPRLVKASAWLKKHGGSEAIPSWGKFWLATLGLYRWDGLNPLPPELWMLPYWFPLHPGRFWCHCRMVYLPMCYIYGKKATLPENDLIASLKEEIFLNKFSEIDWPSLKWHCSPLDTYTSHTYFLKFVFGTISLYEKFHSSWLRKKSLQEVMALIRVEDESTNYIDIGPVNKTINMLSVYYEDGADSATFKKHYDRMFDYLWLANDGMKMQGYNGSQLWDTAFALQAIIESGLGNEFQELLKLGHHYLDITQVREDVPDLARWYRHQSKGAWPFSTRDHGWPISDCTGEGLKAALLMRQFDFIKGLEARRYEEAVDVMLSLQNADGGWPSYELKRSGDYCEWINPSECFSNIMVDYSYVECSSSCMKALFMFRKHFPVYRAKDIDTSLKRGLSFIKKKQRSDGSWVGNWAVCVSYAMWYIMDALMYIGESPNSPYIKKACQYLASKQRADGGWGESFQSCVKQDWVEHDESQTVNTAWCIVALTKADYNKEVIEKGVQNLMRKQLPNGDWKQEGISGVFNANCAISYSGYKNFMSIWALSAYVNKFVRKEPVVQL